MSSVHGTIHEADCSPKVGAATDPGDGFASDDARSRTLTAASAISRGERRVRGVNGLSGCEAKLPRYATTQEALTRERLRLRREAAMLLDEGRTRRVSAELARCGEACYRVAGDGKDDENEK